MKLVRRFYIDFFSLKLLPRADKLFRTLLLFLRRPTIYRRKNPLVPQKMLLLPPPFFHKRDIFFRTLYPLYLPTCRHRRRILPQYDTVQRVYLMLFRRREIFFRTLPPQPLRTRSRRRVVSPLMPPRFLGVFQAFMMSDRTLAFLSVPTIYERVPMLFPLVPLFLHFFRYLEMPERTLMPMCLPTQFKSLDQFFCFILARNDLKPTTRSTSKFKYLSIKHI